MPITAFRAIENSIVAFLGGARVSLNELEKGAAVPEQAARGERRRRSFHIGQPVRVRVKKVETWRRIDFELVALGG